MSKCGIKRRIALCSSLFPHHHLSHESSFSGSGCKLQMGIIGDGFFALNWRASF